MRFLSVFSEEMKDVHAYDRDIVIDDSTCLSSQCEKTCEKVRRGDLAITPIVICSHV